MNVNEIMIIMIESQAQVNPSIKSCPDLSLNHDKKHNGISHHQIIYH